MADIAKATGSYIRISPFKVRRIANEIKNKNVLEAEAYLSVMTNKGAAALKKVIHSARTNFLNKNTNIEEESVYVNKILIDQGPMMKRFHPIAKGRVQRILKRSCHIYVEVAALEEVSDNKGDK